VGCFSFSRVKFSAPVRDGGVITTTTVLGQGHELLRMQGAENKRYYHEMIAQFPHNACRPPCCNVKLLHLTPG
jgi:hypothetical protein